MVTSIIPKTANTTPILFFKLNVSLKISNPTKVDKITIPTLLTVNNTELSKSSFCKAFIKNMIEK